MAHEAEFRPQDAAVAWALTLLRPLLHPRRRAFFEEAMATVFQTQPEWVSAYTAGVLTCLAGTLPDSDPWRAISAKTGPLSSGLHPPASDGVTSDITGQPFGTWRDAVDLIVQVFAEPESDPSLVELADPLSPEAGYLLAAASGGDWEATRTAVMNLHNYLASTVDDLGRPRAGFIGVKMRDVAREAIGWAMHRRSVYGGDLFCEEILLRWTTLASRAVIADTGSSGDEDVAEARRQASALLAGEARRTVDAYRVPEKTRNDVTQEVTDAVEDVWGVGRM